MSSTANSQHLGPYSITTVESDQAHQWAVVCGQCDLLNVDDELVAETVSLVRRSYGENAVIQDAQDLMADELLSGTFNLAHLTNAIRLGLPDPDAEGHKPLQLTNYRSQTAEMIAKGALALAFGIQYPVAAQETSGNPNQPILGFDGWGISVGDDGHHTLVLIQVKATDEDRRPPREALKLIRECKAIPVNSSAIARALTSMVILLKSVDNEMLRRAVLIMLERLGKREPLSMHIAPAIVRGTITSDIDDLSSIRAAAMDYAPAIGRGVSVSIGVTLEEFGKIVMQRARGAV